METGTADQKTPVEDADSGATRLSRADEAYQVLKRRILDNDLPAGAQLLEQELAESLNMSRTPVREAMVQLERDGLVEIRPRHGMRVLPISADDMREIYDILTALESTAAGLAAERGLSEDEIATLDVCVAEMDAALAANDLRRWARADEEFHARLTELSGNARLTALVEGYVERTHRVRMVTLTMRPKPTRSNQDHRKVVDAIRQRDPDRARRTHRRHRQRASALLTDLLRAREGGP
ncbi:GntR family transcriptional regulator [uncultured Rhodospira sp.]|uniref:GntR family transcriptional regulator n=1 Tax=uncultured Rhodospira sp. TaxID=1936189 RepID=UPI0026073D55|nr:GntR family transcriptional regulator [uncultured Rhodospira sp.]